MRAAALTLAFAALAAAETFRLPVIADTWIQVPEFDKFRVLSAGPGHGSETHLVIKGRDALALLHFDVSPIKGMTVSRATLRIYREADPVPLHTVGFSTVSGSAMWTESGAAFAGRDANQPWSYAGSDLIDVTFGQGGSLYSYQRVRDAGNGWWEADVPPALIHAIAGGDQYGLMLDDEKGQTQTRHLLGSREGPHPPVLIVEAARSDSAAPGRVRAIAASNGVVASTPELARTLGRTTLNPGIAIVRFGGAGDDAGTGVAARYELRWSDKPIDAATYEAARVVPRWSLNALAPKPNPFVSGNALRDEVTAFVEGLKPGAIYYFAARAFDESANPGPVSALGRYRAYGRAFPALPQASTPRPAAASGEHPQLWAAPEMWKIDPRTGNALEGGSVNYRAANAIWDAAASRVRLRGAQNEFAAFQIVVEGQDLTGVTITIDKPLFAASKLPPIFQQTGAIQLYREWFVPDDRRTAEPRGWYADPLIPLAATFDIPARDNKVPGQKAQPIFADVYIPHDAKPGLHSGSLTVRISGAPRPIALEVEVLPFTLPDKLSFVVDLNCYSGVGAGWDIKRGTPEYRKLEVAYHRLAHLHRANLDVLGYHHDGSVVEDHTPGLSGEGADTRITDWSAWDAHFGPVLDGSAFSDLPRTSVPVPALYLPFFENWPGDLRSSYKYNDYPIAKTQEEYQDIVTRHALTAAPVEESFSLAYQERFSAVAAQFARHLKERGWINTDYLVYFNDKYYYKRPSQGGRGISWWLMDEPNHRDDVRANAFLSYLLKRGLAKEPGVPIRLRTDISRVEWIRDLMAPGLIDLNCVSQHFFDKNRYLRNDTNRFGKQFWHYASTNHPRESNVGMRAWPLRVWLGGGDGIVPWNTVKGAEAWDRAEPLTVFYVGKKFGSKEPFGSLRLKAYRRGQQDIEYLTLLARQKGWDRDAVTKAVAASLDLTGTFNQSNEEDAGTLNFRAVKDEQLESIRHRVAQALTRR